MLITKESGGFTRANPFALKRTIDALCGPVRDAKALRSGALLVETFSKAQTVAILKTTQFAGTPIRAELADRMSLIPGLIRSDALTSLTNQELLEELAPQGVVMVERLGSRNPEYGPNPAVKVCFRSPLPQHLQCGYLRVPCDPWVPAPSLCKNCWEYGKHTARACRRRKPPLRSMRLRPRNRRVRVRRAHLPKLQ